MQIKEFEALSLKECLQRVRDDMGPEAVILETRKFRKGGVMGMGAKEAVCIVAATGITVQNDLPAAPKRDAGNAKRAAVRAKEDSDESEFLNERTAPAGAGSANAARAVYARSAKTSALAEPKPTQKPTPIPRELEPDRPEPAPRPRPSRDYLTTAAPALSDSEAARFSTLERAMQEIRDGLLALKRQQEAQDQKFTAVVSAVSAPRSETNLLELAVSEPEAVCRFPELLERLRASGVALDLAEELLDSLPDFDAWSEPAQKPMAESALRDLLSRRFPCSGGIQLTPGKLKAVALIGPTGVGKTTTIAKLAAHFSLVEGKKVALLTVDTYRIAAVEQLKTYSQIIDIPIGVAYKSGGSAARRRRVRRLRFAAD